MRNGHNHRDELRKIQTLAQERILPLINQLTNRDLHIRLPLLALEFEKNQEFNVAINDLREFVKIPVDALPTSFEDSGAPRFFRRAP